MTTDSVALLKLRLLALIERYPMAKTDHDTLHETVTALTTLPHLTDATMARAAEWLHNVAVWSEEERKHYDAIMEALAAYEAPQVRTVKRSASDVASLPVKWGEVRSKIVRALAAIVNAPQSDAQLEAEVIPREFVMLRVMEASTACDEFSAALASPVDERTVKRDGELLALADRLETFEESDALGNGDFSLCHTTAKRLRTLATERREVEVTDEMVERACRSRYSEWDNYSLEMKDSFSAGMRRNLTAALQPSGEKA